MKTERICIFGTGGFGRATLTNLIDVIAESGQKIEDVAVFMVSDDHYEAKEVMGVPILRQSDFSLENHWMIIAVSDPVQRKKIVAQFPTDTQYAKIIHPTAVISEMVEIGEGTVIAAGTVVSCSIRLGKHSQLNFNTTVGHDSQMGDYFTTGPGANISGACEIGECVYFGSNSAIRQGVQVCDRVTIGMGGVVLKDIEEKGTYVGIPAKKVEPR